MKIPEQVINALRNYPISYRLKKLRNISGYTQKKIGEIIGVKQNTICAWENGRNEPHGGYLEKYIRFFDLPLDFFIDLEVETAKLRKDDRK